MKSRETSPDAPHRKQDWSWKTGSPTKQQNMERYVEWLLLPESERVPPTKKALAEEMGVSDQTLRNYRKEPWLQRELVQRGRAAARVDQLPAVLQSLYAQAVDPDNGRSVQAAKVWLEWINRQVEPSLDTDIADMTDEELRAILTDLVDG